MRGEQPSTPYSAGALAGGCQKKKTKAQMKGSIELAEEVSVEENGGGEDDHADEDEESETMYSEEHAAVY